METPGMEVYRPAVGIMAQRGYGPRPWILIDTVGWLLKITKIKIKFDSWLTLLEIKF